MIESLSPCIGICELEVDVDRCRGCLRTLAEVAAWPTLSETAKAAVLADLKRRLRGQASDSANASAPYCPLEES